MRKKLFTVAVSMMAFAFVGGIASTTTYAEEETTAAVEEACNHQWQETGYRATLTKDGSLFDECTECFITKNTRVVPKIKTVKLDRSTFTYNGKAKKPKLIVKDSKGKTITSDNYRIKYQKGRKVPGYYKVKVEFIKKYMGEKTLWFKINPKKASIKKATISQTSIKLQFKRSSKQMSGYQVRYATTKSFTGAKIKGTTKNQMTIKGLEKGTTYYMAVRTFKTVKKNGKTTKVYSKWSAKKQYKTQGVKEQKKEARICYEMLDVVNEYRIENGLEPYTWGADMEKGALIRAKELATSFSHTRPNGKDARTAWIYCDEPVLEEVAASTRGNLVMKTPRYVRDAWLDSPGHCAAIKTTTYTENEVAVRDCTFIGKGGVKTSYKKGDIIPGENWDVEMCCAEYDGYWIMVIRFINEQTNEI